MYGLLGPNGSGKSTLFRIVSTALKPTEGSVRIHGADVVREPDQVRSRIAVVFQYPSVDEKLTVAENLRHHGYCYGLKGAGLRRVVNEMLERFDLDQRKNDLVEHLSGGMRRKIEIAKGLLSRPELVLMDEPTTGLDPVARRDFWELIRQINRDEQITFLTTTHLMDEAERCGRVAILDKGHLVAEDSPGRLRSAIGGEVVEIQSEHTEELSSGLEQEFEVSPRIIDHTVRFDAREGHHLIPKIIERFPDQIQGITLRKPTLEDVFIYHTGHRMEEGATEHAN